MGEPLLFSSSPVFTVGGEVRGELARDLLRLEIAEGIEGLKTLRARFLAFGPEAGASEEQLLYLTGDPFDFGKDVSVSIGPATGARTIFAGKISAIEATFEEGREPEVSIAAEDELMDLRMTRRMRTYREMSDADIASAIAGEHGLAPQVDAAGPTYDVVQQWNQSDLAFLRERARLIRAEIWVLDGQLFFQSRDKRSAPELTLVRGNDLISVELKADLAHQRTAVHVAGYDAAARGAIDEQADGGAIDAEVSGGRTGPSILSSAFGERVSHRVREVPLNATEATDWARAEMLRRARGFVQVAAVTRGTADLVVGGKVTLERVGTPFSGAGYVVTRVCQTYDLAQGHRTLFEAERPTIAEAS
ncbi:MAG TPA: contractile injection system protein, VgrG/Pvc8 family [Thermoanaerobaculia bacterium]|nr:contractile injection system protein, VgrG/Pvc8 family [Thermoanaerobaculia bacterium]